MTSHNYWIGVVSHAHVKIGVQDNFIQLNHGKKAPLQRFRAGDGRLMYSPRTEYPDGDPLQHLTAIGIIGSKDIYQVEMNPDFKPFRIEVEFMKCKETPIRPLIEKLSFIKNKKHWGASFRFGQVKVPRDDFLLVANAMGCEGAFE